MKSLLNYLFISIVVLFSLQSCVDKDYDWDDIDTNIVVPIPPVQFSYEKIYIEGLPSINAEIPEWIELPQGALAVSDTLKGIFSGDAIKNFFYEGSKGVEIEFVTDISLELSALKLDIYFNVIDENDQRIENLKKTVDGVLQTGTNTYTITFKPEDMQYMQRAKDLEVVIVGSLPGGGSVEFKPNDYVHLKLITLRTGGMHWEL